MIDIWYEVNRLGGARAVAAALKVSRQTIYHYVSDARKPSKRFLDYLGLERIVIFKRLRKQKRKRRNRK